MLSMMTLSQYLIYEAVQLYPLQLTHHKICRIRTVPTPRASNLRVESCCQSRSKFCDGHLSGNISRVPARHLEFSCRDILHALHKEFLLKRIAQETHVMIKFLIVFQWDKTKRPIPS